MSLALLIAAVIPLRAQRVETGFLDRSVSVAGQPYKYQGYVPANYASQPRWPVILFLHGAGERGADGLIQTNVGLAPAIRQNPARYPAIVIFPQVPTDSQWVGAPADAAFAALAQTMKDYHTDPARDRCGNPSSSAPERRRQRRPVRQPTASRWAPEGRSRSRDSARDSDGSPERAPRSSG